MFSFHSWSNDERKRLNAEIKLLRAEVQKLKNKILAAKSKRQNEIAMYSRIQLPLRS